MFYQAWVETPSNLDVLQTDVNGDYIFGNGIVGELAAMRAEWPGHTCSDGGTMAPGTRVYNGRKLNHVILSIDSEDPLTLAQGVIDSSTDSNNNSLDWDIVALEYLYHADKYTTDENGDTVAIPADLAPTNALEPWLADVADENGDPQRPALPVQLNEWSGCVVMQVPAT